MIAEFYKTSEVCAKLNISRYTLKNWLNDPASGFPKPVLVGSTARYSVADVEAFINKMKAVN